MTEDLDKLREARRRIENLTDQIPRAFDAEKRRIEEESRARLEQGKARLREDFAHMPRPIGTETDIEFKQDGTPVLESLKRRIRKWDDGYGNELFTGTDIPIDKIQDLSRQISAQKEGFSGLSDEEKAKVEADFKSSEGKSSSSKPYSDYLHSEALGRRYQELKKNPPMPFDKK